LGKNNHEITKAIEYLRVRDHILKDIIDRFDAFSVSKSSNYFTDLVRSIIGQQLSVSAARSIYEKLVNYITEVNPENIASVDKEKYREFGISVNKATFIIELANRFLENPLKEEDLNILSDEDVISKLTEIKGVGQWTAQMFLIFSLNRLDVLPLGDAGFLRSIKKNYLVSDKVDLVHHATKIAEMWRPYRSIGVWYMWQEIDNS
jgi:DNA-3-methyladenine glycosylase II